MRSSTRVSALVAVAVLACAGSLQATEAVSSVRQVRRAVTSAPPSIVSVPQMQTLPSLPERVAELNLLELFKRPIGPRGLEIAPQVEALDGKRVRVLGYMVCEKVGTDADDVAPPDDSTPKGNGVVFDRFMLTFSPQVVNYAHYGLCDDLPPQTLFVTPPEVKGVPVPFTPRPLLLTGILGVGLKTEPDGRISVVRLKLDRADVGVPTQPAQQVSFPSVLKPQPSTSSAP